MTLPHPKFWSCYVNFWTYFSLFIATKINCFCSEAAQRNLITGPYLLASYATEYVLVTSVLTIIFFRGRFQSSLIYFSQLSSEYCSTGVVYLTVWRGCTRQIYVFVPCFLFYISLCLVPPAHIVFQSWTLTVDTSPTSTQSFLQLLRAKWLPTRWKLN